MISSAASPTRSSGLRRLMRRRGEYVERAFAHAYDTGGMRRTHLRGNTNILKRILIHVSGFNLGLIMRQLIGVGTPRGLQGRPAVVIATLLVLVGATQRRRGGCPEIEGEPVRRSCRSLPFQELPGPSNL